MVSSIGKYDGEWYPVCYASRTLSKTEQNYAQIEKECLALVFACTKFHYYIYGRKFECITDHKPLETLFKKSIDAVPARIQRMMLVLLKYPNMSVQFKPGTSLKIADTLSRDPQQTKWSQEINDLECQVHMVTSSLPITEQKLEEFKKSTDADPTLQKLRCVIKEGWPKNHKYCPTELNEYWQHRDSLTVIDGLIYKGECLVVPTDMRKLVKEKLHGGHLGISKCTAQAKTYFFWPSMIQSIKDFISKCSTCQENRNAQPKQPNLSIDVNAPWHTIGCDIFHHEMAHYLIMTDYFSSFPEVLLINKGAAHGKSSMVIEKMKSIFSRHGIPSVVRSDGGPQFKSHEFDEFAKSWEFKHELSDPYYPRGNSKVERSVQTVKNLIIKAHASKTDVYAAILAYRTAPLNDCQKSPAELLMNRQLRTRINSHVPQPASPIVRKKYNPKYANMHARDLPTLNHGDNVRIRHNGRWSIKAQVIGSYGDNTRSYIVETFDGKTFRRNRQHLLKTAENWTDKRIIDHYDDDDTLVFDNNVVEDNENINNEEQVGEMNNGVEDTNRMIINFPDNFNTQFQNTTIIPLESETIDGNPTVTTFSTNDFRRFSNRITRGIIDRYYSM